MQVLRLYRREMTLAGLSAGGNNIALLAEQVREFRPGYVHVANEEKLEELRALLPGDWEGMLLHGEEGLHRIAAEAPADLVMVATVGWVGLEPALAAIRAGRSLALANKEVLVCGGHLVTRAAEDAGVMLLPVDSEHNAIFQCLKAGPGAPIRRLILTCSGGPYLHADAGEIAEAPPERTLQHPTWSMGAKISVDSATLINKGFEVIEAHHLFHVPYEKIQVIIHPQSTVHSMVEYVDGSILAQMGVTDMSLPIAFALTYPRRRPTTTKPLDFARLGQLTFSDPDLERFPALALAYAAGQAGGSAPCVLNAANEVAVALHLAGAIPCGRIPAILEAVMDQHRADPCPDLEALRQWDQWARVKAREASGALPAER